MLDPLKLGLYILLFIPGFIFVQTKDYHLLREKKPQLQKTLEIVLMSAAIWLIFITTPILIKKHIPVLGNVARSEVIKAIENAFKQDKKIPSLTNEILKIRSSAAWFFVTVNFWSFISAFVWGILRKTNKIDGIILYFVGRDWYPSVVFKFYRENLEKAVRINTNTNSFLGVLHSTPDNKEDNYVILKDPYLINEVDLKLEPLTLCNYLAINLDSVTNMWAIDDRILKKKEDG